MKSILVVSCNPDRQGSDLEPVRRLLTFSNIVVYLDGDLDVPKHPDLIVVVHGAIGTTRFATMRERLYTRCQNILFMNGTHLPDSSFIINRSGYSGWNSFGKKVSNDVLLSITDTTAYEETFAYYQKLIQNNKSKYVQPELGKQFDESNYYLLVGQVGLDSVKAHARINSSYYDTMAVLLAELSKRKIHCLFKQHPKAKGEADNLVKTLIEHCAFPTIRVVEDQSIHTLIDKSLGVITVNSGVGFESLLHLKRVFTFGESDYTKVTTNLFEPSDFDNIQNHGDLTDVEKDLIKRFLHIYRTNLVYAANKALLKSVLEMSIDDPTYERFIIPI